MDHTPLVELVDLDLLTPRQVAQYLGRTSGEVLPLAALHSTHVLYDGHRCLPLLLPEQALEIKRQLGPKSAVQTHGGPEGPPVT